MNVSNNFKKHIAENVYPGRGIVIGRNDKNSWVVIYWIMGRSANSRNRIFKCKNNIVSTEAADPLLVEDPSLIIYNVMRDANYWIIVSNGSHTDTIYNGLMQGKDFHTTLYDEKHEPDAPNYTSRISGGVNRATSDIVLARISKSLLADKSEHYYYRYGHVPPGYGYCVTTYMGDGDPLPAFRGNPFMLPLKGSAKQIANTYWEGLNADNRISLMVRSISEFDLQIINANERT